MKKQKKRRQKKRKKKKIKNKKKQTEKKFINNFDLKPWERPRMKMYQMPELIPPETSKEERLQIIKSIGEKAQKDFEEKYPLIEEWFKKYDALYLLSFCSRYFTAVPEGIDLEVTGKIIFHHHYLEIMQAFALRQERSFSTKPLLDDAEKIKNEMQSIGNAMKFRYLNIPENLKIEEVFTHKLRTEMMLHTAAIRNWAYPHQISKVVNEIAFLLKNDFEELYKINPVKLFKTLFIISEERNELLNNHIDSIRRVINLTNYKEIMHTYHKEFKFNGKITDERVEESWTHVGKNLEKLKIMLISHSDLLLEKVYSFSIKHFENLYGEKANKKDIEAILDKLSYNFKDLTKNNPEYFILDNPVHLRPFIKIEKGTYYSSIYGIIHHLHSSNKCNTHYLFEYS